MKTEKNLNTKKEIIKYKKWFIPISLCIIIAMMGFFIRLYLYSKIENTDGLFMLGSIDPITISSVYSIMWVGGIALLPICIFGLFKSFKDKGWGLIVTLSFFILIGCIYLMLQDKVYVMQGVQSYEYYTDGTHSLVLTNAMSADNCTFKMVYTRADKNSYTFCGMGPADLQVKWNDNNVSLMEDGNEFFLIDYSNFFVEK